MQREVREPWKNQRGAAEVLEKVFSVHLVIHGSFSTTRIPQGFSTGRGEGDAEKRHSSLIATIFTLTKRSLGRGDRIVGRPIDLASPPGNLAEGSIADPPERFAGRVKTECGGEQREVSKKIIFNEFMAQTCSQTRAALSPSRHSHHWR